ncbi:MAG: CHASE3 domain-containing protein [Mesorhizobium sp.]|nr:histidine kinase dimerization/phosphoacceptor domain -containing protein [Mesorhizobium sp.]MBL8575607.1 CHASE3 domain-containing protein [Mesorhizobium sp.]
MPTNVRTLVRSQILFIAVGVLALLAIVSAAFWLDDRYGTIASQILDARDLKSASVDLGALIQRAESSQRGFLYTENEIYLAPYDLAKEAALRDINTLPSRGEAYADLVPVAERLKQVITDKFAEMDEGIRLTRSRERSEALDLVLTNRGKALMDEAMVYINGLSLAADRRLTSLVSEQTANTLWQRLVSIVGAAVVAAAAFAALFTIIRYARELSRAHIMLSAANTQLETKVANRTADLAKSTEEMRTAKDRAESLVLEVNHRVANSLAIVSSLIGLQANASGDASTKTALTETQSRIQAVALVHQRLYSSDNVTEVALDDYLRSLLDQFQTTMGDDKRISLSYHLEPISLRTDATVNLGVIAAEWVMNAAKYAYPERVGPVRVNLTRGVEGDALLSVEDDGVGRGTGSAQGTGLGSRIVKAMATALRGRVEYVDRNPGLSARLAFPLSA